MEGYGKTISWDVAKGMLDMAAYIFTLESYNDSGEVPVVEAVNKFARGWFESFCDANGIEEVEEP